MTTVSGSTASSPGTQSILKPLEEAPFSDYLRILRENDHEDDAIISEEFYVSLLTGIELGDGKILSKEQVYRIPFKALTEMAELLLNNMGNQIRESIPPPSVTGPVLKGDGADKLSPEQVDYLMRRQIQILEEEKLRLG